jgi:predicted DNA-binding transcriptional regulator AlpA
MSHPTKLCSMKELRTIYGICVCRQTIYRWIEAGEFPRPVRLGQARIAFRCEDVETWITERV